MDITELLIGKSKRHSVCKICFSFDKLDAAERAFTASAADIDADIGSFQSDKNRFACFGRDDLASDFQVEDHIGSDIAWLSFHPSLENIHAIKRVVNVIDFRVLQNSIGKPTPLARRVSLVIVRSMTLNGPLSYLLLHMIHH